MGKTNHRIQPTLGSTRGLERHSSQRMDADWLNGRLHGDTARIAMLVNMKPVIRSNPDRSQTEVRWFTLDELRELGLDPQFRAGSAPGNGRQQLSFLGSDADGSYFALAVDGLAERNIRLGEADPVVDLRSLALQGAMAPRSLSLLGEARALAAWHDSHRCCGRCGSRNTVRDGGWRLKCVSCAQVVFPRTDPVVIMLVTDGDRCLLGREHRFAENFYSCLAGFMEPGEDIEDAVRREVSEETTVQIGDVTYHSSQPWPFPHTLMIGCVGRAETTDIVIDPEIQDAKWVGRDEIAATLDGAHPDGMVVPKSYAIAHHMLRSFADGDV